MVSSGSYSTISIPSVFLDRGDQPFPMVTTDGLQRMLGPPTIAIPFSLEVFKGSIQLSSLTVTFPSTSFQYHVFHFGENFLLPSATFSGGLTAYVNASSGGRLCFPKVIHNY